MRGRRQAKGQQELTAFFPPKARKKKEEDEEEEEEEGSFSPPKPKKAKAADEEEGEENGSAARRRQQPARKARSKPEESKDVEPVLKSEESEEEEDEHSAFWWVWQRELGLRRRLNALAMAQYKDDFATSLLPRLGLPYFLRVGHDLAAFGGQHGSLGLAGAASGVLHVARTAVCARWTSEAAVLGPARVAVSSDDGTLRVWRLGVAGLDEQGALDLEAGVYSCDATEGGSLLLLGATKAGTVAQVDPERMALVRQHAAHEGVAKCVRGGGGGTYVSCGNDGRVRLWDARAAGPGAELHRHRLVLNHVDVRGPRLLCSDRAGCVTLLDRRRVGPLAEVRPGFRDSVLCKPVWRDESTFVVCCDSRILVCSERGVEQSHDTGLRLAHLAVAPDDPSRVYGITNGEYARWTL